jgi:catechol 2,3-dioxygenase-like lactoylglutathione lyase family enzyme
MHLNHVDLQVEDVQASATFFERFFGFTHTSNRGSPAIAILRGGDEATVVRMHDELAASDARVSDVQKNGRGCR